MSRRVIDNPEPGTVCPETGRVAVLAGTYADSDLNGDAWAYWFNPVLEEWGMDPWRRIEGVDRHTSGVSMDLIFEDGNCKTVGPLRTIFLSAKDAARLGGGA